MRNISFEEIANSITHGAGLVLSIVGLVVLVAFASIFGSVPHIVSCSVFGTTLVLLYASSTLYHSFQAPRLKRIFKTMDHACIYLLIAGTYTPFTLVSLRGGWGWALFGIVWGMAAFGVVFKIFFVYRFRILSIVIYLLMGWLVVIAAKTLLARMPAGGLILLLLGGLSYTGGVVFYVWKRIPYHHAVWHIFVLAGSAFHYFAVLFYVLPL
ncbi:MAG: hemolysin III family protein [Syntrophales bacterium]